MPPVLPFPIRKECPPGACVCGREDLLDAWERDGADIRVLRLTRDEEKQLIEKIEAIATYEELGRIKQRLQELGIGLESEAEVNAAFARFKELADRKADIFDEDILALVSDEQQSQESEFYRFVSLEQRSSTGETPTAKVAFFIDGEEHVSEGRGDGPVDATVNAIEGEVGSGAELVLFSVNAISTGTQSQGEVTMRLSKEGRIVNGVGADPDIIVASAKAYLSALNKLQSKIERVNPQP